MDFDFDRFKAERPLRDVTFWVALLTSLAMLLPVLDEAWRSRKFPTGGQLGAASSPLSAWLLANGVLRYGSVRAAGVAAASVAPEVAMHEAVFVAPDEYDLEEPHVTPSEDEADAGAER